MSTIEAVRSQYEDLPYPPRDPRDEQRRLVMPLLDDLDTVNHYGWRARRDLTGPLRVLVAGGGTGDSTVFLAHQLRHTRATLVHLDLSGAAIGITRQRLALRGLDARVQTIQASLLDLPRMDLEPFDYINCAGVLHHLDAPERGLEALTSVLRPDGVLGLMVYAAFGREGIYLAQRLLRIGTRGVGERLARIALARRVLAKLPTCHPLRRAEDQLPDLRDDAELQDMFLHTTDRAYTLPQLEAMARGAGLRIAAHSAAWRPFHDLTLADLPEGELRQRIDRLPLAERRALAERFWGLLTTHECWLTRRDDTVARLDDDDLAPVFSRHPQAEHLRRALVDAVRSELPEFLFDWQFRVGSSIAATRRIRLTLDRRTRAIIERIDGTQTVARIVGEVAWATRFPAEAVRRRIEEIFNILAPHDVLLLRHNDARSLEWSVPPVRAVNPPKSIGLAQLARLRRG